MKLEYASFKDDDLFIFTDFNCKPSIELLKDNGLYKIIWCKDNDVALKIDGYNLHLEKDQVVFCTPLNIIEIALGTKGLLSYVFNKEFFCIQTHDEQVSCNGFLFFGSSQPQVVRLCEKELKQFEMMRYFFVEEFNTKDAVQGEMLRTLLKRLLIMSTRMIKKDLNDPGIPNAQLDIVRQFNLLVEQHFREKHQVGDYADLLFRSPKTLSNLFRKFNKKAPLMVINERILLEAKRLLVYSDKTADEIAKELGYKEAGHFSKFFKRNEGISPKEFRKLKSALAI